MRDVLDKVWSESKSKKSEIAAGHSGQKGNKVVSYAFPDHCLYGWENLVV